MMPLKCPECANTDEFYRVFKAIERIWTDEKGLVVGYKDEETLEILEIECRKCRHKGTPEEFGYEG